MSQRLGQHFLKNQAVIKKIVATIDPRQHETIIEVGPGRGALTIPLAQACARAGAKVIAIEKDPGLVEVLHSTASGLAIKNLEVLEGDALAILRSGTISAGQCKLVGNIPYYLTGHLLRTISELAEREKPKRCVFMLQKEVAERTVAEPPKMNRLAASVQFWAEPKIIAQLGKNHFSPPPKVDSAVIVLETRRPQPEGLTRYYAAVRSLFAQPRKTILNNLRGRNALAKLSEAEKPPKAITEKLSALGINSGLRPQNLTVEDIDAIAKKFF